MTEEPIDDIQTKTEETNKGAICEIRCLNCGKWFKSGIQFGDAMSFDTSILIGNKQQCQFCGYLTECNKENMRFKVRKSDGFVYYVEGKDTF